MRHTTVVPPSNAHVTSTHSTAKLATEALPQVGVAVRVGARGGVA